MPLLPAINRRKVSEDEKYRYTWDRSAINRSLFEAFVD
jgi:hypothetical protein